jgi:hypothetical protein
MSTAHERRLRRRVAELENEVLDIIARRGVRTSGRMPNGLLSGLLGSGHQRKRPVKSYRAYAMYYGHDRPGSEIHDDRDDIHMEDAVEAHNKKEAKEQLRAYVAEQGKDPSDYEL